MSDANDLYFTFELDTEDTIDAEFELGEERTFDVNFEIQGCGTFGGLQGSPYDNTALADVLNDKVDTVIGDELISIQKVGTVVNVTSKTFIFEQGIASSEWVIVHNLDKRPTVTAVDSSNRVQIPDEIVYNSDNQVTIQFTSSFAGHAYLN